MTAGAAWSIAGAARAGLAIRDDDLTLNRRDVCDLVESRASELRTSQPMVVFLDRDRSAATVVEVLASLAAGVPFARLDSDNASKIVTPDWGARSDRPLAYYMPTSGSTGRPNVVAVGQASLEAVFAALVRRFSGSVPEGITWSQLHQLDFGYSLFEILGALVFGGSLVAVRREEPLRLDHLADLIRTGEIGVASLTPTELSLLRRRHGSLIEASMGPRVVFLSGERPDPADAQWLLDAFPGLVLISTYAAVETSGQIAAWSVGRDDLSALAAGYIGEPLDGVTVTLRPFEGADDGEGELVVSGDLVADGYLDPLQTAARFRRTARGEREFATRDVGYRSGDGSLHVRGRVGRRVKIGGRWHDLDALEEALEADAEVDRALACDLSELGQAGVIGIAVVPVLGAIAPTRLRRRLVAALGVGATVKLAIINHLPQLTSGKSSRRATDLFASERSSRNPVLGVWEELLGDGLDRRANLFEMGVDSMGLAVAAERIAQRTGRAITVEWLLDHPTIASQVEAVAGPVSGPNQQSWLPVPNLREEP